MFSSARSIIATLVLSTIVVGTPPLAGSESWADFFRDLFSIADYESMIEDENKITDQLNRKDAVILGRLNSKNKVIDALEEGKISCWRTATNRIAMFYFLFIIGISRHSGCKWDGCSRCTVRIVY